MDKTAICRLVRVDWTPSAGRSPGDGDRPRTRPASTTWSCRSGRRTHPPKTTPPLVLGSEEPQGRPAQGRRRHRHSRNLFFLPARAAALPEASLAVSMDMSASARQVGQEGGPRHEGDDPPRPFPRRRPRHHRPRHRAGAEHGRTRAGPTRPSAKRVQGPRWALAPDLEQWTRTRRRPGESSGQHGKGWSGLHIPLTGLRPTFARASSQKTSLSPPPPLLCPKASRSSSSAIVTLARPPPEAPGGHPAPPFRPGAPQRPPLKALATGGRSLSDSTGPGGSLSPRPL